MAAREEPPTVLVSGSYPPTVCGVGDYAACLAHHLPGVAVWTGREGAELAARAMRERPPLLHLQYEAALYEPSVALRLPAACRRAGVPLVATLHALDGPAAWGRARRLALLPLLLGSDALIVCAGRPLRALRRAPSLAAKTRLVPVGSTVPVTARRTPTGDPAAALRLAYFGFVWAGRGLEAAVRALAAVSAASPTGATLSVVGEVREPAHAAALIELARTLGVGDRLTFTGALPAPGVSRALADADLALLPYPTGASTGRTTLMAALAHGLPVVTTALTGNRDDRFRDGENLLLAPAGDDAAFARAAVRAAADPALRARLAAGAAGLSCEFSWERIAEATLRIYDGVRAAR